MQTVGNTPRVLSVLVLVHLFKELTALPSPTESVAHAADVDHVDDTRLMRREVPASLLAEKEQANGAWFWGGSSTEQKATNDDKPSDGAVKPTASAAPASDQKSDATAASAPGAAPPAAGAAPPPAAAAASTPATPAQPAAAQGAAQPAPATPAVAGAATSPEKPAARGAGATGMDVSTAMAAASAASAPAFSPAASPAMSAEVAPPEEKAFFDAVGSQIQQAWFLHGDPLVIMIGGRPYLVSPSKDKPIKNPQEVAQDLGQKMQDPKDVAQAASSKNIANMLLWVSDVQSLQNLAKDFSGSTILNMQMQAKLRGFYNGQEHNKDTVLKMDHADLVKLGWSTLWLRGGMGRDGVLKLAVQAGSSSSSSMFGRAALLEEGVKSETELSLKAEGSAYLSAAARKDREWFRSMMRATPSDGINKELATQAKEILLAFASGK